ncbi:acyltransferase family protein [Flavobacterium lacustre]|uniref:acyltransferase family protein n=1 Tax=Flavobacterium lacustre TaxID=3016339 RepID=UPI0022B619AA|nr:acyltransferase [Flavobacterium lacustre]
MEIKKQFFLNGLNELRAIAALSVTYHHIEMHNGLNSIYKKYNYITYFTGNLGKNGVFLFFVLSGFLITYLLLKEKETNGTVLLKKFFFRRAYRIWPLYYLIFIISVIVIPLLAINFDIFKEDSLSYNQILNTHNYGIKSVVFYLFLMPNVALYSGYFITGCSQAWSVGVEEQFYIIWPFFILLFNKRRILQIFFSVLVLFPVFIFLAKNDYVLYPFSVIIKSIPFHFMAIGSIGGYFFFYKKHIIERYTKSKTSYFFLLCLILIFLFYPIFINEIQDVSLSFLFLILILFSINDENPWVFKNQCFSYLGKISFGIYMYHTLVMFLVFPFVNKYVVNFQAGIYYNILLYPLIFIITILFSSLSYKYFESKFIKIKDSKFKVL